MSYKFGMPGGIISSVVLIAVFFIAGYLATGFLNTRTARITITPGKALKFGNHTLANSEIEQIGLYAGNLGAYCFRVYALVGGEKIYITEFVTATSARAIQERIRDRLEIA